MSFAAETLATLTVLRRRRRMTQAELARRAGTTQPAIARMEAGAVSPSLRTVDKVLDALGYLGRFDFVSTGELRTGGGPPPHHGDKSESGVDLSQIRRALRSNPQQRLVSLQQAVVGIRRLLNAVER